MIVLVFRQIGSRFMDLERFALALIKVRDDHRPAYNVDSIKQSCIQLSLRFFWNQDNVFVFVIMPYTILPMI